MRNMWARNTRGLSLTPIFILGLVFLFAGLSLLPAGAQPIEVSIPDIQRTDSPTGDSPLLGQVVTVDGIVTALDPRDGGLDGYFIQEPEGGPWSGVYVSDASGNRPAVGDLIRITGQVDERLGLTVVANLQEFSVVSNDTPLPAARGVTAGMLQANGEPWESVRVAVHGVVVVSENPDAPDDFGEWLVADATNDATVRVGHLLGDYEYIPIEGDTLLMVRGVVYFSFGAFKIEPATSADILQQADYTSIYEIQTVPEEAEGDASPLVGQQVRTAGVVTGVFFPPDEDALYVIEDVRGGPWSGVWVRAQAADVPVRGAHVALTGTVREYFGRTELFQVDPASITVHSLVNPLPAPVEISTIDIATGRPSAESYEGVLIRVGPVTVTNANPDAPDDFGEWLIADTSGTSVRVAHLGDYEYTPTDGDELAFVQGPVDYTFLQFKIQPRDDKDIVRPAILTPTPSATPTPALVHTIALPNLFKRLGGCTSVYTLTNTGDVTANVLHQLTDREGHIYTMVDSLAVGGQHTYDLAAAAFDPPLPDGFAGSGTIRTDQPLTMTVQICPQGTAAEVVIHPASQVVGLNGTTATAIQVLDVMDLYGVEIHIAFNPNVVQVIDADPDRPGVQVTPGTLFTSQEHFIAQNQVDNEAGTITFAATLLSPAAPIEGSGDLMTIAWRGVAPGTSAVELSDVVLSREDGQPIPALLEDGAITVLQATATPPATPTTTPTATPTPEVVATPPCDGGLCGGMLAVRAFYDFRCDGDFNAGVDQGIGGAQITLRYDNGAQIITETTDRQSGLAYFSGVNLPDGTTATLSITWPAVAEGYLETCPTSRDTVTLTAEDFSFGSRTIYFRAGKAR